MASLLRGGLGSVRQFLLGARPDKLPPTRAVQLHFEAKNPFYTKPWFAYGLLVADLGVITNMCYISWFELTEAVPQPSSPLPSASSSSMPPSPAQAGAVTPGTSRVEQQLRPAWQRAVACSLFITGGCAVAAMFLYPRRRLINRLYFLPGTSSTTSETPAVTSIPLTTQVHVAEHPPQIFVQTVHQIKSDHGRLFPLDTVKLMPCTKPAGWMELWVSGVRGKFELALDNSRINGDLVSREDAEALLLQAYSGKDSRDLLPKPKPKPRWTKGPLKGL